MVRRGDPDRVVVVKEHFARHFRKEVLPSVVERFLLEFVLFERFLFHKEVRAAHFVKEGDVRFVNVGAFERIAVFVRAFENRAAVQVAEFALVKRLALTRFDKLAFDHNERISVNLDFQAFTKFAGVVRWHWVFLRFDGVDWELLFQNRLISLFFNLGSSVPKRDALTTLSTRRLSSF